MKQWDNRLFCCSKVQWKRLTWKCCTENDFKVLLTFQSQIISCVLLCTLSPVVRSTKDFQAKYPHVFHWFESFSSQPSFSRAWRALFGDKEASFTTEVTGLLVLKLSEFSGDWLCLMAGCSASSNTQSLKIAKLRMTFWYYYEPKYRWIRLANTVVFSFERNVLIVVCVEVCLNPASLYRMNLKFYPSQKSVM